MKKNDRNALLVFPHPHYHRLTRRAGWQSGRQQSREYTTICPISGAGLFNSMVGLCPGVFVTDEKFFDLTAVLPTSP